MPYVSVVGDTLKTPAAATPVPVALTVALPPLLRILIFELLAPEAAGANVILSVALPPAASGAMLVGENANSALDDVIPVTLRVPVPVFDSVTVCAADVVPIVWLP